MLKPIVQIRKVGLDTTYRVSDRNRGGKRHYAGAEIRKDFARKAWKNSGH
jgi:hypothetical protein